MGLDFDYTSGQTPIDEEEKEGLRIPAIATREELDEYEQQNIEDALLWVLNQRLKTETIFSEKFVCLLHRRMYGSIWSWAGKFRKTDKNLGIDKWQIPLALKSLCEDALFWVRHETYSPDEIAIRFKHRIVTIHCFPNGNGRHSRLMADVIISKIYKRPLFSWGSANLVPQGESRSAYLSAVKEADNGDYDKLLTFARG
jgi:Fic-DOC domain mobile mystery protein B